MAECERQTAEQVTLCCRRSIPPDIMLRGALAGKASLVARLLMGGLLLAASLLTAQQLMLLPGRGHVSALDLFRLVVMAGEFLLALWLFSGKRQVISLRVGSACFGCFVLITLWDIFHGIDDCGCFGKWAVGPKVTYWIDWFALSLGMWALRTQREPAVALSTRRGWLAIPAVLCVSFLLFYSAVFTWRVTSHDPTLWLGKPWPPPKTVKVSADLSAGRWVVFLYHSWCGHCLSLVADYAEWDRVWKLQGRKVRVALIDATPDSGIEKTWSTPGLVEGSFETISLYRNDPMVVVLDGGRIVAVHEGWDHLDWDKPPFAKWIE